MKFQLLTDVKITSFSHEAAQIKEDSGLREKLEFLVLMEEGYTPTNETPRGKTNNVVSEQV